ncbi:MAG: carbamoyltransferase HypF [Desulfovibrionaceae bacterium]
MSEIIRFRFTVTGQVQGVGFRPFVYRLALEHGLTGRVRNAPEGVLIEVQGGGAALRAFEADLTGKLPPLARIITLAREELEPEPGEDAFAIVTSTSGHGHRVLISPDIATCPDCLADLRDPNNRRYHYPFTNCTNCGPRYTITRSIPYDRPYTSMACFPMCPECEAEYGDPLDRRFHAQPNACPICGPEVWLTDVEGGELARDDAALRGLARRLADGAVMAVKGLGGFHLACDAVSDEAVDELRIRKGRPHKPLAVMVPDLDAARRLAHVSEAEAEWLTGVRRPIVLVRARRPWGLARGIAPDTDFVGVMLPYTPLHHVLLEYYAGLVGPDRPAALVMTSGNMSSEPICLGNREALARLSDIADGFLFHNRDILIRNDDSVLRVHPDTGAPIMIRRARGFAPEPVFLPGGGPCVLGLGPELKCTLTYTKDDQAFCSQHLGDMQNLECLRFHGEIRRHLADVLQVTPELVVRDLHPDYMTSRLAEDLGLPVASLQHHYAHAHAVLAENRFDEPALCLALDGTGYGEDGTIWGGELLYVDPRDLTHRRLGHLAAFRLPGGEAAVRQPWRIAQGLLADLGETGPGRGLDWPWLGRVADGEAASGLVGQMLERNLNCPRTSSCGRLFDALAGLLGLVGEITYEGQAAILLEKIQDRSDDGVYRCELKETGDGAPARLDTLGLFAAAVEDLRAGATPGQVSRRFHIGLCRALARAADRLAETVGVRTVALSGGCMLNLTLARRLPHRLAERGLTVLTHRHLPPGDGCISVGQAAWGRRLLFLREP